MSELRRNYNGTRILIEAERVLDSSFAAQGLYLTGAQIEMLRNITHYLNRRSTFVGEYHDGYYLMPDDTDWDAIQAIIADMEDKLMSTENVPWGYNVRWKYDLGMLVGFGGGTATHATSPVPAGTVRVLEGVSWQNQTGARSTMVIRVTPSPAITLAREVTPLQYDPLTWFGRLTLQEGDKIEVKQINCLEDDYLIGVAWGYDMAVPE